AGGAGLAVVGLVVGVQALAPGSEREDVGPAAAPSVTAPSEPAPAPPEPVLPRADDGYEQAVRGVFADAGYTPEDAVELGELWRVEDPLLVEAVAGQRLQDGVVLPIRPGQQVTAPGQDQPDVDLARTAFFATGYDVADAAALAQLWGEPDLLAVKALAGQRVLDGQPLPLTGP
ncbi:MAG: hypothetical protein AVDCRST_MAG35-2882, partial [uncultured Quadrisphaera sp.]